MSIFVTASNNNLGFFFKHFFTFTFVLIIVQLNGQIFKKIKNDDDGGQITRECQDTDEFILSIPILFLNLEFIASPDSCNEITNLPCDLSVGVTDYNDSLLFLNPVNSCDFHEVILLENGSLAYQGSIDFNINLNRYKSDLCFDINGEARSIYLDFSIDLYCLDENNNPIKIDLCEYETEFKDILYTDEYYHCSVKTKRSIHVCCPTAQVPDDKNLIPTIGRSNSVEIINNRSKETIEISNSFSTKDEVYIILSTLNGVSLISKKEEIQFNGASVQLSSRELTNGIYLISIIKNGKITTEKIAIFQ